jgi:hypothetical protein
MDKINKFKKTDNCNKNNPVLDILKSKKSLIWKLKGNLKSTEKEFIEAIKQRQCFKEKDWFGFETKDWELTTAWAIDALNNFDEYGWEEATAHDQWFLTWYESAISDIENFDWKSNYKITKEDFNTTIDNTLYFIDVLHFQLLLESEWSAELNLTETPQRMFIRWDEDKLEFYKKWTDEPDYEVTNKFTKEEDTMNSVYFIIDKMIELDEKWERECENCWEQKEYRMFDIDWTNLVELLVCNECWEGRPFEKED